MANLSLININFEAEPQTKLIGPDLTRAQLLSMTSDAMDLYSFNGHVRPAWLLARQIH